MLHAQLQCTGLTLLFIRNRIELQPPFCGSLTEQLHHTRSAIVLESNVVHNFEGEGGRVHPHLHSILQLLCILDATGSVIDFLFVNLTTKQCVIKLQEKLHVRAYMPPQSSTYPSADVKPSFSIFQDSQW